MNTFRDALDKAQLGLENKRLSALLAAILDVHGPFRLTQEQAEEVRDSVEIEFETTPEGEIIISTRRSDD